MCPIPEVRFEHSVKSSISLEIFCPKFLCLKLLSIAELRGSFDTYPKDDTIEHFPAMKDTSFIRRLGGCLLFSCPYSSSEHGLCF
jgi:hypothetical protein